VCADNQGAFTGEVSAAMLKDVGCDYTIVGHSERRLLYRESDQLVARKFAAAHSKALIPILCVGEQLSDREAGRTAEVVQRQLDVVLELCGAETLATALSRTSRFGRLERAATPHRSRLRRSTLSSAPG